MAPAKLRIALIVKPGQTDSGIGRYAVHLETALRRLGHQVQPVYPLLPLPGFALRLVKKVLGWDLAAFFQTYPIRARYPRGFDIYHFSSQNLAALLVFCPPPGVAVVTVHDIIPVAVQDDPEQRVFASPFHRWMDALAMRGLKKARWLVADSEATRQDLVRQLGLAPDTIQVAALGVLTEENP